MEFLVLLALGFYAFIALAPVQVHQMFLAFTWGACLLGIAGMFLYYLGRILFS